jgi:hypothetical protein
MSDECFKFCLLIATIAVFIIGTMVRDKEDKRIEEFVSEEILFEEYYLQNSNGYVLWSNVTIRNLPPGVSVVPYKHQCDLEETVNLIINSRIRIKFPNPVIYCYYVRVGNCTLYKLNNRISTERYLLK